MKEPTRKEPTRKETTRKEPTRKCVWLWAAEDAAPNFAYFRFMLKARYQLFKAGEDVMMCQIENKIRAYLKLNHFLSKRPTEVVTYDQYRYIVDRLPKSPKPQHSCADGCDHGGF